jgi:glycine cleavage system H lipoate-binding protein
MVGDKTRADLGKRDVLRRRSVIAMTVIFVALTILFFLGVDWLLQRRKEARAVAPAMAAAQEARVRLPSGVFFAPSHTWLNLFPSGRAWLGIDDFVVRLLERPRVRFLKEAGAQVGRGDPLLVLEDGERQLTVRSPVDARVTALNSKLLKKPGALRQAPFCEGWACELKPDRQSDLKSLMLGGESAGWMQGEFGRLRDVLAGAGPDLSPAMLQDGGPPIAGAMKHVGPDVWTRFEREFLEVR